ncbi:MAG: hypothetical protein FWE76_01675 [Symbiobacteriaceae bacterium]|nr:hypothetical protein [Symbiobacteriaceae bacterium]
MQTLPDLKRVFNQADSSFEENISKILRELAADSNVRQYGRQPFRIAYATVAMLLFLTLTISAVAYYNQWGVMDFIHSRGFGVQTLPYAEEIVQNVTWKYHSRVETPYAVFTAREAVFDGQHVYVVITATPTDEKYQLKGLHGNDDPSAPNGLIKVNVALTDEEMAMCDEAVEQGIETIYLVVNCFNRDLWGHMHDYIVEDDGTLVFIFNSGYEDRYLRSDIQSIDLQVFCTHVVSAEGLDGRFWLPVSSSGLYLTLLNSGNISSISSTAAIDFPECGIRVDKLQLTGTAMATYVLVDYTVTDEEVYATTGGVWFEILDERDLPLPSKALSWRIQGGFNDLSGKRVPFRQRNAIPAMPILPRQVRLAVWDRQGIIQYGVKTIELR